MVNIDDMTFRDTPWEELLSSCLNTSLAFCDMEPSMCPYHGPRKLHWDCFSCQMRFKELCYRVFEEICEAIDAASHSRSHFVEEIADAMIFWNLTKFLATGLKLNTEWLITPDPGEALIENHVPLVSLGMMTNAMKLRPWRKQFTPIDRKVFESLLNKFEKDFTSWLSQAVSSHEIKTAMDKKDQVNFFRIRSNY